MVALLDEIDRVLVGQVDEPQRFTAFLGCGGRTQFASRCDETVEGLQGPQLVVGSLGHHQTVGQAADIIGSCDGTSLLACPAGSRCRAGGRGDRKVPAAQARGVVVRPRAGSAVRGRAAHLGDARASSTSPVAVT